MGIKLRGPAPGRGDPCPCGSELKFRNCHGDGGKQAACDRIAFEHMSKLIMREKHKRKFISDDQYKMFKERYDPEVIPAPVTERDVNELIASTGLTRCACGAVIPDDCEACVKCKGKNDRRY